MNTIASNAGSSLVEGLVSLTILCVGVLGVSTMSIQSIRNSHTAQLRTKAVFLAADMADRIRANRLALSTDDTAYVSTTADGGVNGGCTDSIDGTGRVVPASAACPPDVMARHDLYLWKQLVSDSRHGLPGGRAAVQRRGSSPEALTVTVHWREHGEPQRYDLHMQVLAPPVPIAQCCREAGQWGH